MAIDPSLINTVKVGQLPPVVFSLTDLLPKEVSGILTQNSVQNLADVIADYIGTVSSLAFNPTTVLDGGTLPVTSTKEWMLVGKGIFTNVGGGPDITTTEQLNALTSNGTTWSLAVEIPINVELAGIVQTIRSGFSSTAPSENAVFNALALKANISDIPAPYVPFPKIQLVADGVQTSFNLGTSILARAVFREGALLDDNDWSQTGTTLTLTFPPSNGERIKPI